MSKEIDQCFAAAVSFEIHKAYSKPGTTVQNIIDILLAHGLTRPDEGRPALDGIALIAAERQRQISQEGWTPEHDDTHVGGTLSDAAACYAMTRATRANVDLMEIWPWDSQWWKPRPDKRIRELEKAGALIAAEIDRLQRKATSVGRGTAANSSPGKLQLPCACRQGEQCVICRPAPAPPTEEQKSSGKKEPDSAESARPTE